MDYLDRFIFMHFFHLYILIIVYSVSMWSGFPGIHNFSLTCQRYFVVDTFRSLYARSRLVSFLVWLLGRIEST